MQNFVWKTSLKTLGRPNLRRVDNINMNPREISCGDVSWMEMHKIR